MDLKVVLFIRSTFGAADAISFDDRKGFPGFILTYEDGSGRIKMDQLMVYTALFCLEYGEKPASLDYELRIYQER